MMTLCSQRVYLLKLLQSQGLQIQQLHIVLVVLILSRIIYTVPAWEGHVTRQLQERLYAFLKRVRKFGICNANYTTAKLLYKADARILGLYKDQNTLLIIFYQIISTVVLWSWDTEVIVFPFLGVNIICMKTSWFRGVCSNMFSLRRLYISSNVLCIRAFPAMLAFVENK